MPKIMVFAGSARSSSVNKQLARAAAKKAEDLGAHASFVDLRDYPIPIYDGDLEEEAGVPENVDKVRDLMLEHNGLIIACPEYNGSITPLLKNVIDWTSRPSGDTPGLAAYQGKVAALISASPGALGGLRGLNHVRTILAGIGVHVIPAQASVGSAFSAFNEAGELSDPKQDKRVQEVVESLVTTTQKLNS